MALKATIFKAELQLADLDRHHYADYSLTLARHPSETDARMMVRLLAFALNASEHLEFTKGLCVDEEPELWARNLSGEIELWIELGQPDEKRLRKACGRARRVLVYTYSGNSAAIWWQQIQDRLAGLERLSVVDLPAEAVRELAVLARRSMRLQCTIQDGQLWLGDGEVSVAVSPRVLQGETTPG